LAARRDSVGFTLIELLIAIAIFSMIIGLASYSFAIFTRHWDGLRGDFSASRAVLQRIDLFSQSLSNAIGWVVADDAGGLGFYFLGDSDGFTLVTATPMFDAEGPAVIRVLRERVPDGQGWQLVYEEASLRGVVLRRADQELPFSKRVVVARGLSSLKFQYLGWLSTAERSGDTDFAGVPPRWLDSFDGLAQRQQPLRIAISIDGLVTPFTLPDRDEVLLGRAMVTE
jgi:prepilin-type N-terminal cleavage/methylation domain-containing protein